MQGNERAHGQDLGEIFLYALYLRGKMLYVLLQMFWFSEDKTILELT